MEKGVGAQWNAEVHQKHPECNYTEGKTLAQFIVDKKKKERSGGGQRTSCESIAMLFPK